MTYKEAITEAMDLHAKDPGSCFVGYGLKSGRAMGTLKNVPLEKIREMPTAENLMVGAAIGMSLMGQLPLVYFERGDFVYCAADALINQLDKIEQISHGEYKPALIIRVTVGNRKKPLFTGPTHTQNPTRAFASACKFFVVQANKPEEVKSHYEFARERQQMGRSTMIVELKDLI